MNKIVPLSTKKFSSYDLRIKYFLKEIEKLPAESITKINIMCYTGKFFETARKGRNLTVDEVAKALGINEIRFRYIEDGIIRATQKEWFKIVHLLNAELAVDQFLYTIAETRNPSLRESRTKISKTATAWGFYDPIKRDQTLTKKINILKLRKTITDKNDTTRK